MQDRSWNEYWTVAIAPFTKFCFPSFFKPDIQLFTPIFVLILHFKIARTGTSKFVIRRHRQQLTHP